MECRGNTRETVLNLHSFGFSPMRKTTLSLCTVLRQAAAPSEPLRASERAGKNLIDVHSREVAFTRKTPSDWIQLCKGWREFYASALAMPPGITWSQGERSAARPRRMNKFLTIYRALPDVNSRRSSRFVKFIDTSMICIMARTNKTQQIALGLVRRCWRSIRNMNKALDIKNVSWKKKIYI